MGVDSSTRRPTAETILSMTCSRWRLSRKVTLVRLSCAAALNINGVEGVDQDVADGFVLQQLLERAQAEDFIEDFLGDAVALGRAEGDALLTDNLLNESEELLLAGAGLLGFAQFFQVETIDQFGVDGRFEFLLFLFAQGTGAGSRVAEAGASGAEVVRIGT